MKACLRLILAVLTATIACECAAYELSTHGAITLKAYQRSLLAQDPHLTADLGIDVNAADPFSGLFGPLYFDVEGGQSFPREASDFEISRTPPGYKKPLSVAGWLILGAIQEDALTAIGCGGGDL